MTSEELQEAIDDLSLDRYEAAEELGISYEHMRRLLSGTVEVREIYRLALIGVAVEMRK